jgi:uncharacterized SAM-binding protein YcdF (DUF218 family)
MYSWQLINALALLLMPPGCLLLFAAWGMVLMRRRPRAGAGLVGAAVFALYVLSTNYAAERLLQSLEPAAPASARQAGAIVVLGGGKYHSAPEYGGADTVSNQTLARLRYAAHLHRSTGTPLLVTGGSPEGSATAEAEAMKSVLESAFGTPVRWTETRSGNTLENARLSHAMLAPLGIHAIQLVTHAWHMPRARLAFEHAGFEVIPAPTGFATSYRLTVLDFMPSARALHDSSRFFHEVIGIAWYRLKFLIAP